MYVSLEVLFLIFTVIANTALAFMVFASNRKSATNRIFGILNLLISVWMIVFYYDFLSPALIWARLSIFFAAPMNFSFFLLAYTLPDEKFSLNRKWFVVSLCVIAAIMAISPFAIRDISVPGSGFVAETTVWMLPFAVTAIIFTYLSGHFLVRRYFTSTGVVRDQARLVMWGIVIMMTLLVATVLLPIIVANNHEFVALTPLYTLVFLGMAAYAIVRHKLFDLKVIATEALTAILWLALFAKIWVAGNSSEVLTDGAIFITSLVFGFLLIKSVRQEVKQREELERLNKEIAQKNDQLEELSRFKSQLLSLASHQIRSPLAAIKGFGSLLIQGQLGVVDDVAKETLGKMVKSVDNLIGLINMLLDLRQVEEGKMKYEFQRIDLVKMIAPVVELFQSLATTKKLEFTCVAPQKEIWIMADAEKLKQVIQNLIDNAIKYTPTGFVHVTIKEEVGSVIVAVTDSGLGFPATLTPYLFEEFVRDERVKKQILGTGLGLYIARKITEAHGGKIWAESPGEGQGSTFQLSVPEVK